MGTYEILEKSSEESFRDIVELKTPSPLRSSESSESNKSLLNGITELLDRRFVGRSVNQDFSEYLDFGEKSEKGNSSSSVGRSSSSSPSSLKQRIRDFPTSSENLKFSDRLAALDRRIRRERDAYLQLLGSNDRIDEKDEKVEGEASVPDEIVMIAADSRNDVYGGSRRGGKASFSAPETTRLEAERCGQRLGIAGDNAATGRLKKFEESRPPKYLRPIDPPGREIIRSNAPPLCLTDEKIVQLLRRGSASAREENLRKSKSARAPGKLAAYGKPTGLIIQNLSSGSEDDGCNEVEGENKKVSGSMVTRPERENVRDEPKLVEVKNGVARPPAKENLSISHHSPLLPSETSNCSNLRKSVVRSNEDTDFSDDPASSRSEKRIEKSEKMKNNFSRLKSVIENTVENHCEDNRSTLVPRLDIKSQDYSRSTSVASREDTTKRSLDVDQLIRALSNVSIQQRIDRQIAWADRHFLVAGSSSRSDKKVEDRPKNEDDSPKAENQVDKMPRKIGKIPLSKSSDYIDPPDKSSKTLKRSESRRIKFLGKKNNFGSFDALKKSDPEKPRRSTLKGQLSEPVTSRNRHGVQNVTEHFPKREETAPSVRKSEISSADENDCSENQTKPWKSRGKKYPSTSHWEKKMDDDSKPFGAAFNIYEDPCEDKKKRNKNLSSETSEPSPDLTVGKDSNEKSRAHRINWKNPASRNLFWADNSSELSRGMASGSSDSSSCRDIEKDSYDSGSRSCPHSPQVSVQGLSKLSSSSGKTAVSRNSGENSPGVWKNSELGKRLGIENANKENETRIGDENVFVAANSLRKRLSYEEIEESLENMDSPRRMLGKKRDRSESAMDAVRKAFDDSSPHRGKISSSLSRLEASPNDSRKNSSNLGAQKKSQDRSPFTITCGKSSPPVLKAKKNEQSETTYRLGFNPSLVRLVNGGVQLSTVQVTNAFSAHPNVSSYGKRRPFVPKIRKFVGKLSRWKKWKSVEERCDYVEETTRVLYENKACRMGEPSSASTSESIAPMTMDRPCSNRDGLWVVGFGEENKSNRESTKTFNYLYGDNDKYEFVATKDFHKDDEPDIDLGHGCFCAKFCQFFIGRNHYYRYTFPSGRSGFNQ